MRGCRTRRRLRAAAALVAAGACLLAGPALAGARQRVYRPIVPDSQKSLWGGPNPSGNCSGGPLGVGGGPAAEGIEELDACGARIEGLAPLPLPANWGRLDLVRRSFVLFELERIERGEAPLAGISARLTADAQAGANANTDPSGGASIWSSGDLIADGMPGWLYDDGPGGYNLACMGNVHWGCWGHRDNILEFGGERDIAVGIAETANDSSAAAVFAAGDTDLTFTWRREVAAGYPRGLSRSFALAPVGLRRVTRVPGGLRVVGASLDTATGFLLDGHRFTRAVCATQTLCRVELARVPAHGTLVALNAAGRSSLARY